MPRALLALGSNLGDRAATIDRALAALVAEPGITVVRRSRAIETAPVGGPGGQAPFLNAAAVIETSLEPEALLDRLQHIETSLGRVRAERWGPRTLDLDLLLYDDLMIDSPRLTVPHPRMAYRRFVLEPAAEVAGDWRLQTLGWTIAELLAHARSAVPSIAFVGPDSDLVCRVAAEIAEVSNMRLVLGPSGRDAGTPVEFVAQLAKRTDNRTWPPKLLVAINDAYEFVGRAPCPILALTGDGVTALSDEIVAAIAALED